MMIQIGVIYGIWSLLTEIPTQGIPNSLNIIQHIFAAIFFLYKWYRSYIGHLFLCLIYTFFKARKLYVHSSSESSLTLALHSPLAHIREVFSLEFHTC